MDFQTLLEAKYLINHRNVFIFLFVLIIIMTLYYSIKRVVVRSRMSNDQKRRFIGNLRASSFIILIASILVLWFSELYQFTLSVAALGAAFAIASKEVLLCFGGSFYRSFAKPFSVGDRIEVAGIRGDVVDIGIMGTQLMEVGPKDYTQQLTGRTITVPNSTFLSDKVFNETDAVSEERDFILHVFKIPIQNDNNWKCKKEILIECATASCEKYIEPARHFFQNLSRKKQFDPPIPEPRVNVKFNNANEILLIVRVSIPVERRGNIEQEIVQNYLERIFEDCQNQN